MISGRQGFTHDAKSDFRLAASASIVRLAAVEERKTR